MEVSPERLARIRTVHLPISWVFCWGYVWTLQMKLLTPLSGLFSAGSAGNFQLRPHCNRLAQAYRVTQLHSSPSLHPWTMPCILHVPHYTFSYWLPSVPGISDCWLIYLLSMLASPSAYQSCMWSLNNIFLFKPFLGWLSSSQNL